MTDEESARTRDQAKGVRRIAVALIAGLLFGMWINRPRSYRLAAATTPSMLTHTNVHVTSNNSQFFPSDSLDAFTPNEDGVGVVCDLWFGYPNVRIFPSWEEDRSIRLRLGDEYIGNGYCIKLLFVENNQQNGVCEAGFRVTRTNE